MIAFYSNKEHIHYFGSSIICISSRIYIIITLHINDFFITNKQSKFICVFFIPHNSLNYYQMPRLFWLITFILNVRSNIMATIAYTSEFIAILCRKLYISYSASVNISSTLNLLQEEF